MHAFGYRILVTVLLPGAMVTAALWLFFERFLPDSRVYQLMLMVLSQEWMGAVVLLLGATLLGTFLASIMSYAECYTLDVWLPKQMGITPEDYHAEWTAYVDSLEKAENPHITQITLYFWFESRTAVASIILGVMWALYGWSLSEFLAAVALILLGFLLSLTARSSHDLLADYRHRKWPLGQAAEAESEGRGDIVSPK
jgi:hypothetical protein